MMTDEKRVSVVTGAAHSASFFRSRANGLFHAVGTVDQIPANFIIDTGASKTTLGGALARQIGFDRCTSIHTFSTANGLARACRRKISSLKFAGFEFANLDVYIQPAMQGDSLIGNDILAQLKIQQQGDLLKLSR